MEEITCVGEGTVSTLAFSFFNNGKPGFIVEARAHYRGKGKR